MKYQHGFHAGNFADVHKHVTLLALLQALQRKPGGLLYFETHAGAGGYDLAAANAARHNEAKSGIGALRAASSVVSEELRSYLAAVSACNQAAGGSDSQLSFYPGSPLLVAQQLRPQGPGFFFFFFFFAFDVLLTMPWPSQSASQGRPAQTPAPRNCATRLQLAQKMRHLNPVLA